MVVLWGATDIGKDYVCGKSNKSKQNERADNSFHKNRWQVMPLWTGATGVN
jgi:hypothetical protein